MIALRGWKYVYLVARLGCADPVFAGFLLFGRERFPTKRCGNQRSGPTFAAVPNSTFSPPRCRGSSHSKALMLSKTLKNSSPSVAISTGAGQGGPQGTDQSRQTPDLPYCPTQTRTSRVLGTRVLWHRDVSTPALYQSMVHPSGLLVSRIVPPKFSEWGSQPVIHKQHRRC